MKERKNPKNNKNNKTSLYFCLLFFASQTASRFLRESFYMPKRHVRCRHLKKSKWKKFLFLKQLFSISPSFFFRFLKHSNSLSFLSFFSLFFSLLLSFSFLLPPNPLKPSTLPGPSGPSTTGCGRQPGKQVRSRSWRRRSRSSPRSRACRFRPGAPCISAPAGTA